LAIKQRVISYLGGESDVVDGVFGALMFVGAEVEENLADSVEVRQRSAGDVHVAWSQIIQDQSHVVTRVHQRPAHLQPLHYYTQHRLHGSYNL